MHSPNFDARSQKPRAGIALPQITLAKVGGGDVRLGGTGTWQVIVVYRGKHCPICRTYLQTLNGLLEEFEGAGAEVIAISSDPKEKAASEADEENWRFSVGYDLSPTQMKALGLYISEPRSAQETDRPFAEPALFITNPEGNLQIIDISNAPFARPELKSVLSGLKFVQEKKYPVRGMLE